MFVLVLRFVERKYHGATEKNQCIWEGGVVVLVHVAVFEVGSGAAGGGALSLGPGLSWRVIAYTVFDAVVRCDLCSVRYRVSSESLA